MEFNVGFPSKFARFRPFSRPFAGQNGPFSSQKARKYAQNHLKNSSKRHKNAFFSFPDLQNLFLDQKSGGRFFHPDGPIFDPCSRSRAGAEKGPSGGQKSAFLPLKRCFLDSKVGFSCSSTPKMGLGSPLSVLKVLLLREISILAHF